MKKALLVVTTLLLTACSQDPRTLNSAHTSTAPTPPTPAKYRQELEVVRQGRYRKKRLMNKSEERVYWNLVNYCQDRNLKVFSQVSLGEVLNAEGEFYRFINAKRIDFCITNSNFIPLAAVEYQGSGHVNETSEERDEVKRTAIESAGILYISLNVGSESDIGDMLEEYLG